MKSKKLETLIGSSVLTKKFRKHMRGFLRWNSVKDIRRFSPPVILPLGHGFSNTKNFSPGDMLLQKLLEVYGAREAVRKSKVLGLIIVVLTF